MFSEVKVARASIVSLFPRLKWPERQSDQAHPSRLIMNGATLLGRLHILKTWLTLGSEEANE